MRPTTPPVIVGPSGAPVPSGGRGASGSPVASGFSRTSRRRLPSVTTQIFIGLLLGVAVGYLWPDVGVAIKPLADAFLRMIKMIIAPLLFSTLVVGIAGTGDLKAMGRIGLKAIVYFEAATTIALFLGLGLVNVFQPGAGLAMPIGADTSAAAAMAQNQQHAWDIFLHLFPTSVVDAMARGDILQLVVFSTFFGIALAAIGPKGQPVLDVLESTAQAMFKVTAYVMAFAPVGVFAAIAATVGGKGLVILFTLGKLVALMYLGLVIFVLVVMGGVSYLIRVPFLTFVSAIREPFLIAFTTASSEAALPKALEVMERFGVPKNIVGFVLPTGYSFNLDGSTLYLSLASIFVAQLAGIQMTFGQQVGMMLTLMLTSKGVAGVPRAALVVLTATLTQFGLPLEGAAILLGIDQVMDMGRTSVNVMGNCIATAVVARWEGVFDDAQMRAFGADAAPAPSVKTA
jgi:proton glutamate symport protein